MKTAGRLSINMTFWDSTFWQNYAEITAAQNSETTNHACVCDNQDKQFKMFKNRQNVECHIFLFWISLVIFTLVMSFLFHFGNFVFSYFGHLFCILVIFFVFWSSSVCLLFLKYAFCKARRTKRKFDVRKSGNQKQKTKLAKYVMTQAKVTFSS